METTPAEIAQNLHAVFMSKGIRQTFTERELMRHYDEAEGAGAMHIHLGRAGRQNITQILTEFPDHFERAGNQWRALVTSDVQAEVLASIADNKNIRGGRRGGRNGGGGRGGRNGGGAGGPIPRVHAHQGANRGHNFGGFRGNHGAAFRNNNQPAPRAPPPPQHPQMKPLVANNLNRQYNDPPNRGGLQQDGPNYRRLSPSPSPPPPPRQYSPPRDNGYYRNDRGRSPSPRYNRDPSPRGYRPSPPRQSYQSNRPASPPRNSNYDNYNNYAERGGPNRSSPTPSDSSGSSEFSQFSTNRQPTTSAASDPSGIEDLARRFNASTSTAKQPRTSSVRTLSPQAPPRPPPPSTEEDEFRDLRIANSLAKAMRRFGGMETLLYEVISAIDMENDQRCRIPGQNFMERAKYLIDLKAKLPDLLANLEIDGDNARWIGTSAAPSVVSQNSFRSQPDRHEPYREDELHRTVLEYVENLRNTHPSDSFVLSEQVEKIRRITHQPSEKIIEKLTYVMFQSFRGNFNYGSDGTMRTVHINNRLPPPPMESSSDQNKKFKSLRHKIFADPDRNLDLLRSRISKFVKFEKFSVRLEQYEKEFESMSREIASKFDAWEKTSGLSTAEWKSGFCCFHRSHDHHFGPRWLRGLVVSVENDKNFRVLLVDYGYAIMSDASKMIPLPPQYREIPPYAILCSLNADDDMLEEVEEMFHDRMTDESNLEMAITVVRPGSDSQGMPSYEVEMYLRGLDRQMRNIKDMV